MATQAYVNVLTTNEQAANGGFTHMVTFVPGSGSARHQSSNYLSDSTADEDMTFNLFKTKPGDVKVKAALVLDPALKDASDNAFNDTKFSFGDEDSNTRHINAVQTNENGTEVVYTYDNTAYLYTAVKQLTVTIESMTAKKLSELDTGRAILLIQMLPLQQLPKSVTG
jgi:hypothetical protein